MGFVMHNWLVLEPVTCPKFHEIHICAGTNFRYISAQASYCLHHWQEEFAYSLDKSRLHLFVDHFLPWTMCARVHMWTNPSCVADEPTGDEPSAPKGKSLELLVVLEG